MPLLFWTSQILKQSEALSWSVPLADMLRNLINSLHSTKLKLRREISLTNDVSSQQHQAYPWQSWSIVLNIKLTYFRQFPYIKSFKLCSNNVDATVWRIEKYAPKIEWFVLITMGHKKLNLFGFRKKTEGFEGNAHQHKLWRHHHGEDVWVQVPQTSLRDYSSAELLVDQILKQNHLGISEPLPHIIFNIHHRHGSCLLHFLLEKNNLLRKKIIFWM